MRHKPQNNNLQSHHGYSLIEMSLVIALLGAFSLVAISMLTTLMGMDTSIATASAFELTAERLEDQLREDARRTVRSEVVKGGVNLITQQGETIQYRTGEGTVSRHIDGERHVSQETFALLESSVDLIASENRLELIIRKTSSLDGKNNASLLSTPEGTTIRVLIPLRRGLRFNPSSNSGGEET